jgi:hypothetical protein
VRDCEIGRRLQGMAQAMTKVQKIAAAGVELVFLNVLKFNSKHVANRLEQGCWLTLFDVVDLIDEACREDSPPIMYNLITSPSPL